MIPTTREEVVRLMRERLWVAVNNRDLISLMALDDDDANEPEFWNHEGLYEEVRSELVEHIEKFGKET